MATGDKIKKFVDESRTGAVSAFIETEGDPSDYVMIPVEDLIVEGDLLGFWIINEIAPHVFKIESERRDLDELIIELAGIDEGDDSLTMTLSFPYGRQVKEILDGWNKETTDRDRWIKDAIKARAA